MNKEKIRIELEKHMDGKAFLDMACVYRTPEGSRCAVGALLPDEIIKRIPSNRAIHAPDMADVRKYLHETYGLSTRQAEKLQQAHDFLEMPDGTSRREREPHQEMRDMRPGQRTRAVYDALEML